MNRLITFDDGHERFENDNVLIIKDGNNKRLVFKSTPMRPKLIAMFAELNKPVTVKKEAQNGTCKI